jgi:hypothetical protein
VPVSAVYLSRLHVPNDQNINITCECCSKRSLHGLCQEQETNLLFICCQTFDWFYATTELKDFCLLFSRFFRRAQILSVTELPSGTVITAVQITFWNRHMLQVNVKFECKVHPRTVREGPEVWLCSFLNLSGVDGWRHAPAAVPPEKKPVTHRTVRWVSTRARLDEYGKSLPRRDSIPGPSNPVGSRYTDCAIPEINIKNDKYVLRRYVWSWILGIRFYGYNFRQRSMQTKIYLRVNYWLRIPS